MTHLGTQSKHSTRSASAVALFRLLSWLPLSWTRIIGRVIGRIAWATNGSLRRITLINLGLCYPELDLVARENLGRASLLHTGQTLIESAWIWFRDPEYLLQRVRIVEGEDQFNDALAGDQGVIIAAPHIGNWEACSIVVARTELMTYMYRPPRALWLAPLVARGRANYNTAPAPLNSGGIRTALKQLKKGHLVSLLPDQEPNLDGGVFAPLFGQPANSMTLLQKLGTRGHAQVLFCVCKRREKNADLKLKSGWDISFLEPDADLLDPDPLIAATAMNKTIERCIEISPEQYLWSYKRFTFLPDGGRRHYKINNT